jgi:hypothetical protein
MNDAMRALEITGTVDEHRQLHLDTPLPITGPSRVRVIILFPEHAGADIDDHDWLHAAAANPAFDFLKDPGEDVYSLADGKPFHDPG